MIGMIRRVATGSLLGALLAAPAWGQRADGPKPLPDAPPLAAPPAAPALGPPPGALESSSFSPPDFSVIGGRARGGSGRIPRRAARSTPTPPTAALDPGRRLSLPSALPDAPPESSSDLSGGLPLERIVEDVGPPDGLTLDDALGRTIAANLDLLALKYEIPQADADILTAGLRANPLIYADAQLIPYGSYTGRRPVGPTEYDIIITQPIDVTNKRRSRLEVARAARTVIEAQLQDAVRRQVGNLYRAFVDFQAARLDVLTAEAAVAGHERVLGTARLRAKPGEDLQRLSNTVDKARDTLADAREALNDAREAVALLMNLAPEEAARLRPRGTLRDPAPPPPPVEELTRTALAMRPDLVAARRGICRAEADVKLARANRMDNVFLFFDPISYQDNRISHQPSGRSWAIGLTVPLPVFDRNQGNIARARSNAVQTEIEMAALERRVRSEVRIAEREYRASRQALERAEGTALPNARRGRARAAADLAAGKIDLTDYLDHLDDEGDAVKAFRDALVRHRRSMLDLNTALGVRLLP